jgi:hypothetical protein
MKSQQLQRAVARATGESVTTIRSRGFSVLALDVPVAEVADVLYLSCPGCGREVPLSSTDDTLPDWAECADCDIAYPYADEEVFLPEGDFACV